MKKHLVILLILIPIFFISSNIMAAGRNYMSLNAGIYSPQAGELKDMDFGTGLNWNLAFGHRYNDNLAYEMSVGNFKTSAKFYEQYEYMGIAYGSVKMNAEIDVIPIILSFKGIIPLNLIDLYGTGGIGFYRAKMRTSAHIDLMGADISVSIKEYDQVFGFHMGFGFDYDINKTWFVGAEGKYLWTDDLKMITKIDGVLATAFIGFRF